MFTVQNQQEPRGELMVHVTTQDSGANAANALTIARGNKKRIFIKSLTVSTSGADIAADISVIIEDNDVDVWKCILRSGQVYGGHFDFGKGLPIRNGDCDIDVSAGGALVVTTVSVVYEVV
jgi:hypothetical protein